MNISVFDNDYFIDERRLTEEELQLVGSVTREVLEGSVKNFPYALKRCTFFGEYGIGPLLAAAEKYHLAEPRVEGDDSNPFDQHYWLAFEMRGEPVIMDPIFNYTGFQRNANEHNSHYYSRKRRVLHGKPQWEGGIRIKTMGI